MERQHRINPRRENLEQRHVGSGGIENRVTDGKTKPEKWKQINREVRKSTARSGLWWKRKSCAKMARFNRYDAVNRSRQEWDSTAGKTKEQKSQHGHTEADRWKQTRANTISKIPLAVRTKNQIWENRQDQMNSTRWYTYKEQIFHCNWSKL
jgi:hypothetical protein